MQEHVMQAIYEHARSVYPNESCGFVVLSGRKVRYLPCDNVADSPLEGFVIAPQDYARAEACGEIIRIIHSHPDVPNVVPSELDRVQCDHSGIVWGILSWPEGDYLEIAPRGDRPLIGRNWLLGHADCWSLIMDYYHRQHGIMLNNYSVEHEWWRDGHTRLYDEHWYREGFREFAGEIRPGDMIMMQISAPVTNHAGIYLGDSMMLHHLYGQLSQRYPYNGYFQERTVRVVRRKELL
ncbi:NlpC/P60 family [Serratia marcescens]|uniref:C40 family peptidase n=1 Tax=Serratia TaxID=613 RepID=UPI000377F516|nr:MULTISPECIES: C40 family peptidase [Serratia]ELY1864560.1 C40 family peptidase [Serratia marcescens]MBN5321924.1 C40 family peptidase [Serratia marcescens]MTD09221.1 peptidase P60 [Serratia sp. YC16]CVH20294.1 NlpC/P60 family [Serratia marcescens]BEM88706.1 peptidase P60 [Serratia marcescens]